MQYGLRLAARGEHVGVHQLLEHARGLLKENAMRLFEAGMEEREAEAKLLEQVPHVVEWLHLYVGDCAGSLSGKPRDVEVVGGSPVQEAPMQVHVLEVPDIEEQCWGPLFGLKGVVDATLLARISESGGSSIAPAPRLSTSARGDYSASGSAPVAEASQSLQGLLGKGILRVANE